MQHHESQISASSSDKKNVRKTLNSVPNSKCYLLKRIVQRTDHLLTFLFVLSFVVVAAGSRLIDCSGSFSLTSLTLRSCQLAAKSSGFVSGNRPCTSIKYNSNKVFKATNLKLNVQILFDNTLSGSELNFAKIRYRKVHP